MPWRRPLLRTVSQSCRKRGATATKARNEGPELRASRCYARLVKSISCWLRGCFQPPISVKSRLDSATAHRNMSES